MYLNTRFRMSVLACILFVVMIASPAYAEDVAVGVGLVFVPY
jgi:hypothetical protein